MQRGRLPATLLLLALASCVPRTTERRPPDAFRDLLMRAPECTAPSAETVSQGRALRDLAVLERILRRGYVGFEPLEARGLDWDGVFTGLWHDVEHLGDPVSTRELHDAIARALAPTRDGHLGVFEYGPRGWARFRSAAARQHAWVAEPLLDRSPEGYRVRGADGRPGALLQECDDPQALELLRPAFAAPDDDHFRLIRLAERRPADVLCLLVAGDGRVNRVTFPFRRLDAPRHRREIPVFERRTDGGVEVVRLRSLDRAAGAALERFVASAAALRSAPALVLDVRGNQGGSDRYVTRFFAGLTSGELRYSVIEELRSEVSWQGLANSAQCRLAAPDGGGEARRQLETDRSRALRAVAEGATRRDGPYAARVPRQPVHQGSAPSPFAGKLVLLVDGRCASSCETFALYARQIPGAVIVGENTAGVGVFGETAQYRLPESGIGITVGTKWFHARGSREVAPEGRGHLPDIWLDTVDPAAAAEALARHLLEDAG